MTILVTGGAGQLATELALQGGPDIYRVGRPDFDFDRSETIDAALTTTSPSVVVNAAAYTAVDAAETDQDAAMRANRDGPARLAQLCQQRGIPLIHISTDYVFDGLKGAPYERTDPTSPQGVLWRHQTGRGNCGPRRLPPRRYPPHLLGYAPRGENSC